MDAPSALVSSAVGSRKGTSTLGSKSRSIISHTSSLNTTKPPLPTLAVEEVAKYDGGVVLYEGLCPISVTESRVLVSSEDFAISDRHFRIRVGSLDANTLTMQLQCVSPALPNGTYVQARLGVRAHDLDKREERLVHCLFKKAVPWGRTVEKVIEMSRLRDPLEGFVARRLLHGKLTTCFIFVALLREVPRNPDGSYYIERLSAPIPEVKPAEELKDALVTEGKWVEYRETMEVSEEDPATITVQTPVWSYHNALWSNPIPIGTDRHIWEFEVQVAHPAEETFGTMKVGVVPRTRFVGEGQEIMDLAAAVDQRGNVLVAEKALVAGGEALAGNTASIVVRVDCAAKTIAWLVNGTMYGEALELPGSLCENPLHPFVMLHYRDDTAKLVRGGVVPSDDEVRAEEERRKVHAIFEWADMDGDGFLNLDELIRLAARVGWGEEERPQCPDAIGLSPVSLEIWYESGFGDVDHDFEAIQERRRDPEDGEFKSKTAFLAAGRTEEEWDAAEVEEGAGAKKAERRLDKVDGVYKTKDDFLAAGRSEEEWAAAEPEAPPVQKIDGEKE